MCLLNRKSLQGGFLRTYSAWNEINMNTMYDRISQHRYSSPSQRDFVPDFSPPKRDFARDFGSTQSDQGEGINGTMLFYIALGVSGVIFLMSMMMSAVLH